MKIEKRPGHDWLITYRREGEAPDYMSVFGAMTAEEALRDARFSLGKSRSDYEILAVEPGGPGGLGAEIGGAPQGLRCS